MNNPLVVLTFVLLKNYLTFTLHFRVIPFAFTVIVALPFFLATTLPLAFTVATLVLDDLNVTLPVGIIRMARTQLKSIIMYKTKIVQVRLVDMVVKSLLSTLIISQKHTVFILL